MPKLIPGTNVVYNPVIESTLIRLDEISPERADAIRRVAKYQVFLAARKAYPQARLVVRDMTAADLAEANLEWTDASGGTANAWEAHQIEDQTITDGRFVAIYGLHIPTPAIPASIPISALRFNVGGAEVARWEIEHLWPVLGVGGTIASVTGLINPFGAITESPIIISENLTIDIDQWVATASITFQLVLNGYVCEKEGLVLRP